MNKKRIFSVDADVDNRQLMIYAFKQVDCSYHLHFFADGHSLLEEISIGHQLPDLILLDHHPPQIDGIQVLKTLKENSVWKFIPVVIWCSQEIQDIIEFYQLGANSYVEKSMKRDTLLPQVEILCSYWFDTVHLPKKSILGDY